MAKAKKPPEIVVLHDRIREDIQLAEDIVPKFNELAFRIAYVSEQLHSINSQTHCRLRRM